MSTRAHVAIVVSIAALALGSVSPALGDRLPRWMFWPKVEPVRAPGVEYRAENVPTTDPAGHTILQAWVECREQKAGKLLWRESAYLRTPGSRVIGNHPEDYPIARIEPFAGGLLVETKGRTLAYFDPKAKASEWVADRRRTATSCELHHRPLLDDLIRIHYGIARPAGPANDPAKSPHANSFIGAGCCVMEKRAAVRYCPACREAQAAPTAAAGRD